MRVGMTSKGTRIIRDDWSFRYPPVALRRLTSAAPLRFASLRFASLPFPSWGRF